MDVSAALTQTVEAVSALQKHEKWSVDCVRSTVNMRSAGRIKSVAAAVEQIRGGGGAERVELSAQWNTSHFPLQPDHLFL